MSVTVTAMFKGVSDIGGEHVSAVEDLGGRVYTLCNFEVAAAATDQASGFTGYVMSPGVLKKGETYTFQQKNTPISYRTGRAVVEKSALQVFTPQFAS